MCPESDFYSERWMNCGGQVADVRRKFGVIERFTVKEVLTTALLTVELDRVLWGDEDLPSAALIIALLAPPSIAASLPSLPALTKPPAHATASRDAKLTQWGAQVFWDENWRAFVAREIPNYAVVPVWERFETPQAGPDAPAPSYVVMREMDCGQHAWRTVGVVRFPAANLEGEARFEPSKEGWRSPAEDSGEVGSIYGSVCRR